MNEQLAARPGSSNGRDFLLAKCLCVKLACAHSSCSSWTNSCVVCVCGHLDTRGPFATCSGSPWDDAVSL